MIRLVGKFGFGVVTRVYLLTRVAVPKSLLSRAPARTENMLFHAAQTCGEGTVRLSSKGESDRITQRSAVQIPPATMNATAKQQWRSPVYSKQASSPTIDTHQL